MLLSPKDPDFPHSAILHAIVSSSILPLFRSALQDILQCASASRWTTTAINKFMTPDGNRRDTFAGKHSTCMIYLADLLLPLPLSSFVKM